MRPVLLASALFGLCATLSALDQGPLRGIDVTFDVLSYGSQHFDMGPISEKWSDGHRYEINGMSQLEGERVQPSGGVYFFYEDREWKGSKDLLGNSVGSASYYCWGFGLQGGATIHLIAPEKDLGFALLPYLRGGIGFQDLTAHDVRAFGGVYDVSGGSSRLEFAAGADLRLTVARHLEFVFGGGVDYWSSAAVSFYVGTGGAGGAISTGYYDFDGTDAFVRVGAGIHF
jgi:hypothetical protein